ncbi:hypothetical protein [Roseomonas sp. HF4]|uniref:hypothetical protein n=1 Tax=Roseomonas sp. HF4 TaxID=2562313 RepID=UPI0010C13CDC|nr:hypothetical protein [Roseomonas sp. HF4]
MQTPPLPPEAAAAAAEEQKRQAAADGTAGIEGAADLAELTLDGTLSAIGDGALAVAEGAVHVVGAVLGGLLEG